MTAKTLYDKIWDDHVVTGDASDALLYVDLHLIHEVTTPQAFAGLELAGRAVRRPDLTLAIADHNIPTAGQELGIDAVADADSRLQLATFDSNVRKRAIDYLPMGHELNGIVHVVGPELGRSRPGMVIVCGDSHTSTHGAFGALAFGIGTSEVEHVLATQTLRTSKACNIAVEIVGTLEPGISAKDIALALIAQIGTGGGTGAVIEYRGSVVDALTMEGRMTLCNMSIEAGARAGLIAPDKTTRAYLDNRPLNLQLPSRWLALQSDRDAVFDRVVKLDITGIAPMVSWGTSPGQSIAIDGVVPDPADMDNQSGAAVQRALAYMDLRPGQRLLGLPINVVFIGSCTNSRIEDLRAAATIAKGQNVAAGIRALVVPGSRTVMRQAEAEGLDTVFISAGFEWREPGCSMCLGMNPDRLKPGQRCASTSNRNFEGRQGPGGRTHLMSPAMAAAAAIAGCIVDVREVAA